CAPFTARGSAGRVFKTAHLCAHGTRAAPRAMPEGMQLEINSAVADNQAAAASRPLPASGRLSAAVREARPRQWPTNLLVLAAPLAGATTGGPGGLAYAAAAFAAFCCASASVYYVNDIIDVERDRLHPVKCSRPIASGDLPVRDAIVIAVTLAFLAIGLGF